MKARYNFWSDRPRNVSRREYNHYQLMIMATIATSFFSLGTGILAVTGSANRLRGTEDIPVMSLAEVMQSAADTPVGTRGAVVKMQGFLQAETPVRMPDAPDQAMLRGRILLKAESGLRDELISETLLEWEESAAKIWFTDGITRLPIAFDTGKIPLKQDRQARAKVRYAGEVRRFAKPVAVEYADQLYPLSDRLKARSEASSRQRVSPRLTREFATDGMAVLLVAAVETTADGPQIVDPLGEQLKVLPGTEQSIAEDDVKTRIFMGGFSVLMGIVAYILKQAQAAKWQEFVIRSND